MGIEEIVTNAKTRLGQTSLSDRSLTEYFTAINPQAEPDDAFWETHTKILKSFGGQYNHDIADWQKKYEAEHKPAEQKQTPTPAPAPTPTGLDPNIKALFDKQNETITKLSQLVLGQQQKASEEQIHSAAAKYGDSLNVEKPDLWKSAIGFTPIGEMTEEQYKAAVKTNYESLIAATGSGIQPYSSGNAGGGSEATKYMDDFFARKFPQNK